MDTSDMEQMVFTYVSGYLDKNKNKVVVSFSLQSPFPYSFSAQQIFSLLLLVSDFLM